MGEQKQYEGRSAAEAAIKACDELGVTRSDLKYDVVSETGEALSRKVVISVDMEASNAAGAANEMPADEEPPLRSETSTEARSSERSERGARGGGGGRGRRDRNDRGGRGGGGGGRGGRDRNDRGGRGGGGGRGGRDRNDRGGRGRGNNNEQEGGIDSFLKLDPTPTEPVEKRPDFDGTPSELAAKAKELLSGVIERLNYEGTSVHLVQDDESEIHLDIRGGDPIKLIGEKGEVLLAFQFLTNRMASKQAEGKQRIIVDAAGYRGRRRGALEDLAKRLAERALEESKVVRLTPMSAHDRRVFHLALESLEGVSTRSEGDGLYRNLLIIPSQFE
jgi:predicted RNA-binding protein Jag